ncbi:MAG: glycosyltransferase family 25 protein [Bacteroidota bacterium]
MPNSLNKLKRRVFNLWLLDYTLAELREWIGLIVRNKSPLSSTLHHVYNWRSDTLYFDQILVISLPFRRDRRENIYQQMSHRNISYTFFEAVDGKVLDINQLEEDFFSNYAKRYLSSGSIGCALSHIRAWQQIVVQGWEYCLILEDDVILSDTFVEDLRVRMPEVPPDFDILYLGSGLTAPHHIRKFISTHVFEPHYPREGMYAYVVSAKGAQTLLQNLFPINLANGGIDTMVGKLVRKKKVQAYHLLPVLCQADLVSPSNIYNPGGKPKVLDSLELKVDE